MRTFCHKCGRAMQRHWYHRFLLPVCGPTREDVLACLSLRAAMLTEPPEPIDYEEPPADRDVCSWCDGKGEVVVRRDWQTGALDTITCSPCGGTGVVPPIGWDPMKEWTPR